MIVTGIGSRKVPLELDGSLIHPIRSIIGTIGEIAKEDDWLLRSGAATGMDSFFEQAWSNNKHIYLPKNNFNGRSHNGIDTFVIDEEHHITMARDVVKRIHPAFSKLNQNALDLHIRNIFQCIGHDIIPSPSDICIYWAPVDFQTGEPMGGTRTAVMFLRELNTPTYNLNNPNQTKELLEFLNAY